MGATKNYEEAMRKYNTLNEQNTQSALDINKVATERAQRANQRATEAAVRSQNKFLRDLENRDLYDEAYSRGSRAAAGQAAAQGAQAQAQARQAGMSKAAAAEMGAQAANNAYGNALSQQQGQAQSAIGQKLGMQQSGISQRAGTMMQGAGQEASLGMQSAAQRMEALKNQTANQQTATGMAQSLDEAKWGRGWDAASKGMGTAATVAGVAKDIWSDENLKDATKTNTDVDSILKKYYKPDFKNLIMENK